ncbi:MAG TPA: SBBP repeat-containing protein [Bryobacteraceae bacterium]|nr:SBBP repeat-containing protein [Bryobacteraceae bacterium]
MSALRCGAGITPYFEPNVGQSHASVQFLSRGVYLGSDRAAIQTDDDGPVVMTLSGARVVRAEGLDLQPGITSYFLGNDPGKWRSGVPHYARVRYRNVYPGIDVVYYHNHDGRLEYDFVVRPGADPGAIRLSYNRPVRADSNGDLLIAGVRQKRARVFQDGREIRCDYAIAGTGAVSLALASYNRNEILTVDPVLEYSTYLGGPAFESGTAIQVDSSGNTYMAILERAPANPALNPFQQTGGAFYAAFVVKFAPDGKSIIYYAYAGGTADTYAFGLAVDAAGNSYLTGETQALDFPTKNAPQLHYGGGFSDAFATKISADGLSIVYSTYLGGLRGDSANSIAVDSSGRAYIGGDTNSPDFPIRNALQPHTTGSPGFLTRLSADGSSFDFSTFYGGSNLSGVNGVALDAAGYVYITGITTSPDFPLKNPFQSTGSAYIAKLTSAGDAMVYSSYLGDRASIGWGVAVDRSGAAFVFGNAGSGFVTKNAFQASFGGGESDLFLAKVSADGSGLEFATYLGGSDAEYQNQSTLAVDAAGNAYVTGWTFSKDFPTKDSLQESTVSGGVADIIVAEFSADGKLVYSTLLGGHGDNRGGAIAVSASGIVNVTGSTHATDFPLKQPFQSVYGGSGDVVFFKLAPASAPASPFAVSPGSLPYNYVIGSSLPPPKSVSVSSTTAAQSFTPVSTASWLKVTGAGTAQLTPATLQVSIDPTGLTAGPYSGAIQIDASTSVQVELNVYNPGPTLTALSPSTLAIGSAGITITLSGNGFQPTATVLMNGQTLASGVKVINATTIQLALDKSFFGLAASLIVTVQNPLSAPSNALTLTVGTPAPTIDGVTNGASFAEGAIAPGEIATLFGGNLTASTGVQLVSSVPLPKQFLNTSVMINGSAAPLFAVDNVNGQQQINFQVPWELAAGSTASVVVENNGTSSAPLRVPVSAAQPGIFNYSSGGQTFGAILHANFQLADSGHPAKAGEIVLIYCTGLGAVSSPPADGAAGSGQLSKTQASVTMGGVDAPFSFSGLAPGFVGLYQVNAEVPAGLAPGNQSVLLSIGGSTSNTVLLPIQ